MSCTRPCWILVAIVCTSITGVGCLGPLSGKYSGEFSVTNSSDVTIWVDAIDEFGPMEPVAGVLVPSANKESSFPPLKQFPSKTVIRWHVGDDREVEAGTEKLSQELILEEIVPKGVAGTTHFDFTAGKKWVVTFDRAQR